MDPCSKVALLPSSWIAWERRQAFSSFSSSPWALPKIRPKSNNKHSAYNGFFHR
jgi:hypothetical protein